MTTQLTATQQAILAHAHQHTAGKIEWFPENIKGGARQKVLDGLFNRALITKSASDWLIAAGRSLQLHHDAERHAQCLLAAGKPGN